MRECGWGKMGVGGGERASGRKTGAAVGRTQSSRVHDEDDDDDDDGDDM